MKEEALKHDQDKISYHLIDPLLLTEVAKVLAHGEKKYAAWDWTKGTLEWHRLYRAAIGHLIDWYMGQNKDPESNLLHLAHAVCCIMFLMRYQNNGWGKDTRPHQLRSTDSTDDVGANIGD